ncbi:MAG TPA: methyltransferase [Steroidobacteraceae bacterium]|nr:methyltransferase [Steroidobacteraceae bacterium]
MAAVPGYHDGLNEKLRAAVWSDAGSVLELGCANGRLGAACKQASPGMRWTGVDASEAALSEAAGRLDRVISMDLDQPDRGALGDGYDLVVFGDLIEHLRDPAACLQLAHEISVPQARLVCCIPNMVHASVIERMLAGDLSYDSAGLLDATHLRFLSQGSAFKLLLDAGWLPNVRDRYAAGHGNEPFLRHLLAAARELGIPEQTALGHLLSYQLIIDCIKSPPAPAPAPAGASARFAVVVPVTHRQQFELNVRRSPGLAEVNAEIIPVEGARNPAEAFEAGRRRVGAPWIVFCHQDVYFPRGTGHQLAALFAAVPAQEAARTLIGFAGIGELAPGTIGHSGLVIDRAARFDHPGSGAAVSIDELAVALSADTVHAIDPAIGWHLWATDLCLAAILGRRGTARIARVPLFHNSYNDGRLPAAFHAAAQVLRSKYPQAVAIPTLCGVIGQGK